MVRFKNRYLLFELTWENGCIDESVAAFDLFRAGAFSSCGAPKILWLCQQPAGCVGEVLTVSLMTCLALLFAVRDSVQVNFGDFAAGALMTPLNMKYFNHLTNLCILRASRDNHELVRAATSLVKSVKGRTVCFTCRHVAGTIRACQEAAIRINQEVCFAACPVRVSGVAVLTSPFSSQVLAQLLSAASTAPEVRAAAQATFQTEDADLQKLVE